MATTVTKSEAEFKKEPEIGNTDTTTNTRTNPTNNNGTNANNETTVNKNNLLEICPTCVHVTKSEELAKIGGSEWIECDICNQWYHLICLNITPKDAKAINSYHCPSCAPSHGPSTYVRLSSRKRSHIDYAAFNRGEVNITQDRHPYASRFDYYLSRQSNIDSPDSKRQKFNPSGGDSIWPSLNLDPDKQIVNIDGQQLTKGWAETTGIVEPVRISKDQYETLGMIIPHGLTVRKVADLLGEEEPVQVVDVLTQNLATPPWNMGQWATYFEKSPEDRDRILNVISLEISGSALGKMITRPQFVRDMDWVDMVWPKEFLEKNDYPKARLYCLMSVKDAYTDFHVDFGGTSVFYHLIYGAKSFVFIRPTPSNLKKYEQWCLSSDQSSTFFADLVKESLIVNLKAGDSLIIPSGWIHAVYTPKDSLIIGGNFLTPINIPTQISLAKLEVRTKVPQKFRYPFFDRVVWYAAVHYMKVMQSCSSDTTSAKTPFTSSSTSSSLDESKQSLLPDLELSGLTDLRDYLLDHVIAIESSDNKSYVKHLILSLPKQVRLGNHGPRKFLQEFAKQIAKMQYICNSKLSSLNEPNQENDDSHLVSAPAWALDFEQAKTHSTT